MWASLRKRGRAAARRERATPPRIGPAWLGWGLVLVLGIVGCSSASDDSASATPVAPRATEATVPRFDAGPFGSDVLLLQRFAEDGQGEIFYATWDGRLGENLTAHPANEHPGAISPDGLTMAFNSDRAGDYDIYLMDLASGEVTQLTSGPWSDWQPVWAPDGARVAFFRAGPDLTPTVFVASVGGAMETAVTDGSSAANHVQWTAEGQLLVWMNTAGRRRDVFLVDTDGTVIERLTDTPGDEGPGAPSPDGSLIAFSYAEPGMRRDIWVMNADGSGRRQLTNDAIEDWVTSPAWTPDGNYILYQRGNQGPYYVVGVMGEEPALIFSAPADLGR